MSGSQQFAISPVESPPWVSGPQFEAPVLVTGVPRSGTSMVTGLLGVCGLWLGQTVSGGRENVHGFFENMILRERVQKEILRQGGFDPLGVRRLPPRNWHPRAANFRQVVAAAIAAQQYDGSCAWGFKDAKMTLTWRLWHEHFPQARWIIVRRPREQIIASCMRTSFMRQHSSDPAFWDEFVAKYIERIAVLQQTVGWSRTIEAGDIVAGTRDPMKQLVASLGLTWQADAVRSFVSPVHWSASQSAKV
jgi:hypothetical protein